MFRSLFLAVILLSIFSCTQKSEKLKFIYSQEEPKGKIAEALKRIIEENTIHEVELIIGDGSAASRDSVKNGACDLAIIENNILANEDVDAIMPLYPEVLHILYKSETPADSVEALFYDKSVFVGLTGSGSYSFFMNLFHFFSLDTARITITEDVFDAEVICGFTDLLKDEEFIGLENFRIFSFDPPDNLGEGAIVNGICMKFPQLRPFVIPRFTYGKYTPQAVSTVSVDAVLVTGSNMAESTVQDIAKAIFENHQPLNEISPLIYSTFTEKFDPDILSFPLHPGARNYLERNEPTFFERYAEVIALVFSILIALYSGIKSLARWNLQRKKDRVDIFYKHTLEVKNEITELKSEKDCLIKLDKLKFEENVAFKLLINEKLLADESFRIYMELVKETKADLQARIHHLRSIAE